MEKEYEIFISSKSEDYFLAEQIYNYLAKNGYSVFLASMELQKIGESAYSLAVDSALDVCTHMIVVSSSIDHIKSKWVQYEWNTFSNDVKSGYKTGNLITILTDNIELKLLPASLRHQQSFGFDTYRNNILGYLPHINKTEQQDPIIDNAENVDSPYAIIECMNNDLTITLCNSKKKKTSVFANGAQDLSHMHESLADFTKLNKYIGQGLRSIFVYPTQLAYFQINDYTRVFNQYGFHVIRSISSVASVVLCYATLKESTRTELNNCLVLVKNCSEYNVGLFDFGMGVCESFGQTSIKTIEKISSFVDDALTQAWDNSISRIICVDINEPDFEYLKKIYNTSLISFDSKELTNGAAVQFDIMNNKLDGYLLLDSLEEYVAVVSQGDVKAKIVEVNQTVPCKRTAKYTIDQDYQHEILVELVLDKNSHVMYVPDDPLLASLSFPIDPPRPNEDVIIELTVSLDANKAIDVRIKDVSTEKVLVYKDIVNHPDRFSAKNKDFHLRPKIYIEKN